MEVSSESSRTGIKEFDDILSGGFPKGSVVLLSGSSGSGKTTFAFQWLFEGVRKNENGIYITLTEPLFRTLKNLEVMDFYSRDAVESESLKILDAREIGEFNAEKTLKFIENEVKKCDAKRLCIDSITAIAYSIDDKAGIRRFMFELGKTLASLGCTTILTSEVHDENKFSVYGVEEFISDAIIRLDQVKVGEGLQHRLQIIKVRGKGYRSDELFYRITREGISIFPKFHLALSHGSSSVRVSAGNGTLDDMMGGGVFAGSSTLITGPSGAGKSLSSIQFIAEGLRRGEACRYAGFEESREQIIRNAKGFGINFDDFEKRGLLTIRSLYPGEKFIDEHLMGIANAIEKGSIKRCAVDSLSALYNTFPEENYNSFSRSLEAYLKSKEVTSLFTANTGLVSGSEKIDGRSQVMPDNIIMLRYVEMNGELRRVMNVVKVNGSAHSKGLRLYEISSEGIVIGRSLSGYEGVTTGVSRKISETTEDIIDAEFRRYLGPMGASVFREMKKRGISARNVSVYIDELENEGILKKEDARKFKHSVLEIIGKRGEE
ncbi:MAG: hypothetical protein HZB68_01480 [Candidatus Aenigmarchaeota archaeon]|nr:hypothetical protein [Candidatus Aenigmarchaeota archaeon]